jgi:hypothetical protein
VLAAVAVLWALPAWGQLAEGQPPEAKPAEAQLAEARPTDREAFARSLMGEGDYFRAITVFKELAFQAQTPEDRFRFRTLIGQGYRLSRRYDLAIQSLGQATVDAATDEQRDRGDLQLALVYLGMKLTPQASLVLTRPMGAAATPLRGLLRAVVAVDQGKTQEAKTELGLVKQGAPGSRVAEVAVDLDGAVRSLEAAPHRSPFLAAALSTVVPGAGQLYADHPVDGLQALLLLAALGTTSYVAWRWEYDDGRPYVWTGISWSITALFYGSNIVGAHRTAQMYNLRAREVTWGQARNRVLDLRF